MTTKRRTDVEDREKEKNFKELLISWHTKETGINDQWASSNHWGFCSRWGTGESWVIVLFFPRVDHWPVQWMNKLLQSRNFAPAPSMTVLERRGGTQAKFFGWCVTTDEDESERICSTNQRLNPLGLTSCRILSWHWVHTQKFKTTVSSKRCVCVWKDSDWGLWIPETGLVRLDRFLGRVVGWQYAMRKRRRLHSLERRFKCVRQDDVTSVTLLDEDLNDRKLCVTLLDEAWFGGALVCQLTVVET